MSYSNQNISDLLKKALDVHGHGFHYAVMRRAHEMRALHETDWVLYGTEFPSINRGETTHIDFILKHYKGDTFLIAECKRADPAKANWCFVKAPYTWTDKRENYVQFDKIAWDRKNTSLRYKTALASTERNIVHLGVEVHTGEKGDGVANPYKSSINQSIAQVLRSSSGFVNYFYNNFVSTEEGDVKNFRFIPVIFTTAQLLITNTNIGIADLATGNLPKDSVETEKVDWLWFNHNRSSPLSPEIKLAASDKYLTKEYHEFVRSIAIVSAANINVFFNNDLDDWLKNEDF